MAFSLSTKPADATFEEDVEVDSDASSLFVQFSLESAGRYEKDGFAVYPNSLLFRAGKYADKKYEATPKDVIGMAADWTPIGGCIEHKKYLKGRAGVITKAWTTEGGKVLRGMVKIPLGLDSLLTDQERKISVEINPTTKRVAGFALTTNPRVDDAVLMSLDATLDTTLDFGGTGRHDTNQGQRAMQEMHDSSVRNGAVCSKDNTVNMASDHEHTAIQAVHDMTCEHGAKCDKVSKPTVRPSYMYYSRDNDNPNDNNNPAAGRTAPRTTKGAKPMPQKALVKDSLIERAKNAFRTLFAKSGMEEADVDKELEDIDFSWLEEDADQVHAMDDDSKKFLVQFSKQVTNLRAKNLTMEAKQWANQMLDDKKCLPSEIPAMTAAYLFAAEDDEANPQTVNFSQGDKAVETSRLETIKVLFSTRAPHQLFEEMMKSANGVEDAKVLFNKMETARQGEKKPMSDERRKKLINSTATGRALLKKS